MLCPSCWLLCTPPDPATRCRHCFKEIDEESKLCRNCRWKKSLPIPRAYVFDPESPARHLGLEASDALAGFAILQWIQLDWPMPDVIVPMSDAKAIAFDFAKLLDLPFVQALSKECEYLDEKLEDNQIVLLFDVSSSFSQLEKAVSALKNSFPSKIYLLSLMPYVDRSA